MDPPAAPDIDLSSETPIIHPPLVPQATSSTSTSMANRSEESRDIITPHFTHFRDDPFSFLKQISLHYSGAGWRSYDSFIGQPIFYPGFSEEMKAKVVGSAMVRWKISELAARRVEVEDERGLFGVRARSEVAWEKRRARRRAEIEKQLDEVADGVVEGMICKFESKRFIRGAYFLCMQLLARTYHQGIHVSTEEIENLRRIATIAQHKKQSLIFLPCHRSHVDYVSLQVLCYRLGIALPVVVAGENLNFPVVGPFLQHAGAMFIRRSFGGDELYTSTVQGYVDVLLKGGYNFECFIEGTRSRTGKLLPPKFGILGFVLDSLLSGRVDDAWVIPVSTQYDKVIETEAYVNELLGLPKPKENLWDFLGSSKYLSLKMGRVDVRFHDPWSLRSFIDDFQSKQAPGMSVTTQYPPEQRLKLLRSLGYRVLGDINKVSVVMPTSLIGTVLLTLRGRGVGKSELVRRMEWLSSRIRAKGGRVAHFGGVGVSTVVDRGLEVLGDLVGRVEGLAEETFYAVDRFQLSFYRNMVIHLFISECLVAAAMYTRIKQGGGPANQRVPYATLLTQVSFLSQLFRGEFVFPTTGLTANLRTTIEGLRADGVIEVGPDAAYVELSDAERRCGRENYDFYCFLIWPFIESSWLAGVATIALTPPPPPRRRPTIDYPSSSSTNTSAAEEEGWVGVKEAQEMTQLLGKTLYHQGDVSYFESVNKQSIGSSFQRFQEDGILESSRKASPSGTPMLRLAEQWRPARDPATGNIVHQGRLWEYVERIAVSRREGKNRRDSASVGSRVLKLAQELGQDLFERAAEKRREDAEKASAAEDRAKRERAML